MNRTGAVLLLLASAARADLTSDVRAAVARVDFVAAERLVAGYRQANGTTAEAILAYSWLGRGALAAKQWDRADTYAAETRRLALAYLKTRPLDSAEPPLATALGASIEVRANVLAGRGDRDQAVAFLNRELKAWWSTSIRGRIQKNLNLLTLEGRPAPPLEVGQWLGPQPQPLEKLKGHPVLLFFWAHWCGDCKAQAAALARLRSEFGPRGLLLEAPTQRYGYVAGGEEAGPERETAYIDRVRQSAYAALADVPAPLSEENFRRYGSSTTPTLVLIDAAGIVRLYHPGAMSYDELRSKVAAVVR